MYTKFKLLSVNCLCLCLCLCETTRASSNTATNIEEVSIVQLDIKCPAIYPDTSLRVYANGGVRLSDVDGTNSFKIRKVVLDRLISAASSGGIGVVFGKQTFRHERFCESDGARQWCW